MAGGAGPQSRRFYRRSSPQRDRLFGGSGLARAQANQGLVCRYEVASWVPPASRRADGSDCSAVALRQGRLLGRSGMDLPAPPHVQLLDFLPAEELRNLLDWVLSNEGSFTAATVRACNDQVINCDRR